MDFDQVMGMLKGKSEVKLVKFVSDKGPNSCEKCLAFHGKVFRADDPEKPELPIHPHCRCRYEELSESEVKSFQNEVLEVKDQVVALGNKVATRATQLLAEFEREINAYSVTALAKGAVTAFPLLLKTTEVFREKKELEKQISSKADSAKIAVKLAPLTISFWTMQKMYQAIQILQNEMKKYGINVEVDELCSWLAPMQKVETVLKNWHYDRLNNPLQQPWALPRTPREAEELGYIRAPESQNVYHHHNGQSGNVKYYHPITGQEVIFDVNGKIVTDPANIGTYNYFPPTNLYNDFFHGVFDVIPYYKWGNSPEDKTPVLDRMVGPKVATILSLCLKILEIFDDFEKNKCKK